MGVWIETSYDPETKKRVPVTPCMGVWIETNVAVLPSVLKVVTPCMGVWIETFNPATVHPVISSHPVWVCGLKPSIPPLSESE